MEFQLWWTGKTAFSYLEEGIKDYQHRIEKYCRFSIHEFKGTKGIKSPEIIKEAEEREILKKIKTSDYLILLDEKGKTFNSQQFASHVQKLQTTPASKIIFVIGGAFGFSEEMKNKANLIISFSHFTFSHLLIRLIFVEQLYRAFTIIHNQPYHND